MSQQIYLTPFLVSTAEAVAIFGVHKARILDIIREAGIQRVKVGSKQKIFVEDLTAYFRKLQRQQNGESPR